MTIDTAVLLVILFYPVIYSFMKKCSWMGRFMTLFTCIAGANMVFLAKYAIDETIKMGMTPSALTYIIMVIWTVITVYVGIRCVVKD